MTEGHSHFCTILLQSVTPFRRSLPDLVEPRSEHCLHSLSRRAEKRSDPNRGKPGEKRGGGENGRAVGQRLREGEEGQRERMRDAVWFCSALRSPGLSVQERMEGKGRQGQESRKSKMEGRKRGIQRRTGFIDEQSKVCRMRCWWEKDPISVFPDQFYQVSVTSRSCFPEHPYSQEQNSESKGRVCVCVCLHACVCAFVGEHRWFMQSKTQPLLASDHKGPRTLQRDDKL